MLRKELIDKVVLEFPHLKTIADNIEKSDGVHRQRFEKNFAKAALNLVVNNLTPMEIHELAKIANVKL